MIDPHNNGQSRTYVKKFLRTLYCQVDCLKPQHLEFKLSPMGDLDPRVCEHTPGHCFLNQQELQLYFGQKKCKNHEQI